MGIDSTYPRKIFENNGEAVNWLKKAPEKDLKKFVDFFLRRGQTYPFPNLSIHNRYPSSVFAELYSEFDTTTKKKIQMVLTTLLREFILGKDSNEYLFNLFVVIATVETDGEIISNIKETSESFNILCEMAEEGTLYLGDNRAYGEDLHLFLLKALFSFPLQERDRERILGICEKYIKNPDYAPICYRQIFDLSPEKGITCLSEYLKSTREKGYHDYMFPIIVFFNRPDTFQIIVDNLLVIYEDVLATLIGLENRQSDFEKAELIKIEKLIAPTSVGSEGEILLRIRASGKEIEIREQDTGKRITDMLLEINEENRFKYPKKSIERYNRVTEQLESAGVW